MLVDKRHSLISRGIRHYLIFADAEPLPKILYTINHL